MSLTLMNPIFPISLKSSSHPTNVRFWPMWFLSIDDANVLFMAYSCCYQLLSCDLNNKFYVSKCINNFFYFFNYTKEFFVIFTLNSNLCYLVPIWQPNHVSFQNSYWKEKIFKKLSNRAIRFNKPYFSIEFLFNRTH